MVERLTNFNALRPDRPRPEEWHSLDAAPVTWRLSMRTPVWRPPTDIFETDDALIVRVEVAGMEEEDFSIELDERSLLIRGVRLDIPERRAYHQMEIRFGEFSTEVELSVPVVVQEVHATYQNGFLRVVLPKARARQIPIQTPTLPGE